VESLYCTVSMSQPARRHILAAGIEKGCVLEPILESDEGSSWRRSEIETETQPEKVSCSFFGISRQITRHLIKRSQEKKMRVRCGSSWYLGDTNNGASLNDAEVVFHAYLQKREIWAVAPHPTLGRNSTLTNETQNSTPNDRTYV